MPKGIYKHPPLSEEHKIKIGLSLLGGKRTEESKKKMSESRKKIAIEVGKKISLAKMGHSVSDETKKKISLSSRGRKLSEATRRKMLGRIPWNKNKRNPKVSGINCNFWKGGITKLNSRIRTCVEYKLWRTQVFKRDNYTCLLCGNKSGNGKTIILNADHVIAFATILKENNIVSYKQAISCKELWDIKNGRTLCKECHIKTDTYAGKNLRRKV